MAGSSRRCESCAPAGMTMAFLHAGGAVRFMCREALRAFLATDADEPALRALLYAGDASGLESAAVEPLLHALAAARVCDPALGCGPAGGDGGGDGAS